MNVNVRPSLNEIIERDFSRLETCCDEIFQRVDAKFALLTSNGGFDALQSFASRSFGTSQSRSKNSDSQVRSEIPFEIRLGSVSLTRQAASALEIDQILSLTESNKGRVQIWSEGRCCGEGALLVSNGKLIVKIVSFTGDEEDKDEQDR